MNSSSTTNTTNVIGSLCFSNNKPIWELAKKHDNNKLNHSNNNSIDKNCFLEPTSNEVNTSNLLIMCPHHAPSTHSMHIPYGTQNDLSNKQQISGISEQGDYVEENKLNLFFSSSNNLLYEYIKQALQIQHASIDSQHHVETGTTVTCGVNKGNQLHVTDSRSDTTLPSNLISPSVITTAKHVAQSETSDVSELIQPLGKKRKLIENAYSDTKNLTSSTNNPTGVVSSSLSQSHYHFSKAMGNVEGVKFSRPLLKNETVLCANDHFKNNYFVFNSSGSPPPTSTTLSNTRKKQLKEGNCEMACKQLSPKSETTSTKENFHNDGQCSRTNFNGDSEPHLKNWEKLIHELTLEEKRQLIQMLIESMTKTTVK